MLRQKDKISPSSPPSPSTLGEGSLYFSHTLSHLSIPGQWSGESRREPPLRFKSVFPLLPSCTDTSSRPLPCPSRSVVRRCVSSVRVRGPQTPTPTPAPLLNTGPTKVGGREWRGTPGPGQETWRWVRGHLGGLHTRLCSQKNGPPKRKVSSTYFWKHVTIWSLTTHTDFRLSSLDDP